MPRKNNTEVESKIDPKVTAKTEALIKSLYAYTYQGKQLREIALIEECKVAYIYSQIDKGKKDVEKGQYTTVAARIHLAVLRGRIDEKNRFRESNKNAALGLSPKTRLIYKVDADGNEFLVGKEVITEVNTTMAVRFADNNDLWKLESIDDENELDNVIPDMPELKSGDWDKAAEKMLSK